MGMLVTTAAVCYLLYSATCPLDMPESFRAEMDWLERADHGDFDVDTLLDLGFDIEVLLLLSTHARVTVEDACYRLEEMLYMAGHYGCALSDEIRYLSFDALRHASSWRDIHWDLIQRYGRRYSCWTEAGRALHRIAAKQSIYETEPLDPFHVKLYLGL